MDIGLKAIALGKVLFEIRKPQHCVQKATLCTKQDKVERRGGNVEGSQHERKINAYRNGYVLTKSVFHLHQGVG